MFVVPAAGHSGNMGSLTGASIDLLPGTHPAQGKIHHEVGSTDKVMY